MWQRLSDALHHYSRGTPWLPHVEAAATLKEVEDAFRRLLPDVHANIHPAHIQGATLTLFVDHPAVAQIVRMNEKNILADLQSKGRTIKKMFIRVGLQPTPGP